MMSAPRRAFTGLMARLAPRVPDFHGLLAAQTATVVLGLDALVAFVENGDPREGERVRELEKEGDRRRSRTLATLARSFATPMDRSSIHLAATAIDDVLNYAKTTVREIEVLDVPPDEWTLRLARGLRVGGRALHEGFVRLREDPAGAQVSARAVHKAERDVEKVFRRAVAEAFAHGSLASGPGAVDGEALDTVLDGLLLALRRREVYRHLSNGADRLDDAGRALLDIVLTEV